MKTALRNFLFALSFLTIFPGLGRVTVKREEMGLSVLFYPLVGLLPGLLVLGVLLLYGLHPLSRAVIAVLAVLVVTRGMHADGIMDTFDGFLSGRKDPPEILTIMRDSRVGALGLIGAAAVYGLKIVFIFELLRTLPPFPLSAVILPAVASRGGVGLHGMVFPSARKGEGLGGSFIAGIRPVHAAGALLIALLLSYRPGSWHLLLVPPVLAAVWLGWGVLCMRKIGGISGDTLGAGIEIAETAGYLMLLLLAGV
jgi:adenosylcobinamide-GDP ribazoletransferase